MSLPLNAQLRSCDPPILRDSVILKDLYTASAPMLLSTTSSPVMSGLYRDDEHCAVFHGPGCDVKEKAMEAEESPPKILPINKPANSEDFERQAVRPASKVYLQVLSARQELRSIRHALTILMKRQTKINRKLQREKKKVHEETKNDAKRLVAALERLVDTLSMRTPSGISV